MPCAWRPSHPARPHAWRAAAELSLKTASEGPRRCERCPTSWRCARPFAVVTRHGVCQNGLHSRAAALKVVKWRIQGYWLGCRIGAHSFLRSDSQRCCATGEEFGYAAGPIDARGSYVDTTQVRSEAQTSHSEAPRPCSGVSFIPLRSSRFSGVSLRAP